MHSSNKKMALVATLMFSVATTASAAPGDVDASFAGGYVVTPLQNRGEANAVAVDAKRRTVVVGFGFNDDLSHSSPTLLRYLPDGRLDTSFGDAHSGAAYVTPPGGLTGEASFCCVRFDSKHRIVAAGVTEFPAPVGMQKVLTVVRLSEDGSLDPSFGNNGIVSNVVAADELMSVARSLAIDAADRILVGGETFGGLSSTAPVIIRYKTDGALDHAFGNAGVVAIPETGFAAPPVGIEFDALGRIVACGGYATGTYVARYLDGGDADDTFGISGNGLVELEGYPVDGFTLDAADRPLLASAFMKDASMGVMRLTSNGDIDASFGPDGDGMVTTPMDGLLLPAAMTTDGSGNVIVSATEEDDYGSPLGIAVVRYTGDGLADDTFGEGGMAKPALPEFSVAGGAVVGADSITITGYSPDDAGEPQFTTARLQN